VKPEPESDLEKTPEQIAEFLEQKGLLSIEADACR
jgi:hypothetical protein